MKDKNNNKVKVEYSGQLYDILSFQYDINKIMLCTIDNGKPIKIFSVNSKDIKFVNIIES